MTSTNQPKSKADLIERAYLSWTDLEKTVTMLTEAQMTTLRGSDVWSVKDHLVHIAAWEQSLLAILQGRAPHAAIGMDENAYKGANTDAQNAFIYQRSKDRPLPDVLSEYRKSHHQVMAELAKLSYDDMLKPYSHYQPSELPYNAKPVMDWIIGDTYEHYNEHLASIQALVKQSKKSR